MNLISVVLVVVATFGACYLFDKGFTNSFRNQVQHKSGLSVRVNKKYAIFGLVLMLLGIIGFMTGIGSDKVLTVGSIFVVLVGAGLLVYYMTFGVFYDADTFLVTTFGKKRVIYRYSDIVHQQLYLVQGGSVVIELHMADKRTVSLQSGMDGTYPFLDHAFNAWCLQTGRTADDCDFHDPANSIWFPMEEV